MTLTALRVLVLAVAWAIPAPSLTAQCHTRTILGPRNCCPGTGTCTIVSCNLRGNIRLGGQVTFNCNTAFQGAEVKWMLAGSSLDEPYWLPKMARHCNQVLVSPALIATWPANGGKAPSFRIPNNPVLLKIPLAFQGGFSNQNGFSCGTAFRIWISC